MSVIKVKNNGKWETIPIIGGAGIPDAPSDGVTYGRKDGSWVKANYSTPDEVLDLSEFLSQVGENTSPIPTPEGIYKKAEDAYNRGISYLCISSDGFSMPMIISKDSSSGFIQIRALFIIPGGDNFIENSVNIFISEKMSQAITSLLKFPNSGTLAALEKVSQLAKLAGYSKPSSYSAISSNDTINSAIGKLEAGLGSIDTILDNINGEVI